MHPLDVENHDGYFSTFLTERKLSPSVPLYLGASYAYYHLNQTVISDGLFDQLALMLIENYETISDIDKKYITRDDLAAGTLLLSADKYPSRAKTYAAFMIAQLRDATRLYPTVFVCPACAKIYSIAGWAQKYKSARSVETPTCSMDCRTARMSSQRNARSTRRAVLPEDWCLFVVHPGQVPEEDLANRFNDIPVLYRTDTPAIGYLGGVVPPTLWPEFRSSAASLFRRPAASYQTTPLLV